MSKEEISHDEESTHARRGERRKIERYSGHQKTFCYLNIQGGKSVGPVEVRHLSAGGFSLVLDQRLTLEIGQAISLYHKGQHEWWTLPVQGVYIIPLSDGKFVLSGAFSTPLSDEDAKEFLTTPAT